MWEFVEIILCLIFALHSILHPDIIMEFSTSQLDSIELFPMLVFGPIVVFDPIIQFLPIITGPVILEPVLINEPSPTINFPLIEAPFSFLP